MEDLNESALQEVLNLIELPDSNVNEVESHGFVTFSVSPANNIEAQDEIYNSAGIYFNFNQPIITNTVKSTFVEFLDEDSDDYYFWEDCNDQDSAVLLLLQKTICKYCICSI